MNRINSAAVVLCSDDGIYALQKRCFSAEIFFRGYWCLFGGLIEPGESPEEAAKRELLEELEFSVTSIEPLFEIYMNSEAFEDGNSRKRYYFVSKIEADALGSLKSNEGLGLKLFSQIDLPSLDQVVPWDAAALGLYFAKIDPLKRMYPNTGGAM